MCQSGGKSVCLAAVSKAIYSSEGFYFGKMKSFLRTAIYRNIMFSEAELIADRLLLFSTYERFFEDNEPGRSQSTPNRGKTAFDEDPFEIQRKQQLSEAIWQKRLAIAASNEATKWQRSEAFRQLEYGDSRPAACFPSFNDTRPPDYESA